MFYEIFVEWMTILLSFGFISVFVALGLFGVVYLFDLFSKGRKESE